MTDAEIIKALECCITPHTEVKCYCCKAASVNGRCTLDPREILDLIRRQQAEIEKLKKLQQRQADLIIEERGRRYELASQFTTLKAETDKTEDEILKRLLTQRVEFIPNNNDIKAIQRDAVINFADRLKSKCRDSVELDDYRMTVVTKSDIDDLVNKMFPKQKGEENGHRQN